MQKEEKKIGEQIVCKIDSLIYLIKKAILSEEKDRERLISEGYNIVQELTLLLEKILGGDSGYTIPAIRELLRQRFSDDASAVGEGVFEILEEMISWGKDAKIDVVASNSTSKKVVVTASSDDDSFSDDVQRAISFLFPEAKIAKNYRFYGVNLGYYIPSLNIAVVDEANEKGNQALKDYLCKSYGIRLVRVNTRELNGYREIARYIKRRLRI